jgi:hypothetical protein
VKRWTRYVLQALAALGDAEYPYVTRHPSLIPRPSRKLVDDAFWAIVTRQWGDVTRPPRDRLEAPTEGI